MFDQLATPLLAAWYIFFFAFASICIAKHWSCQNWLERVSCACGVIITLCSAAELNSAQYPAPKWVVAYFCAYGLIKLLPATIITTRDFFRILGYWWMGFPFQDANTVVTTINRFSRHHFRQWDAAGLEPPMADFELLQPHQLEGLDERTRSKMVAEYGQDCNFKIITTPLNCGLTHVIVARLPKPN